MGTVVASKQDLEGELLDLERDEQLRFTAAPLVERLLSSDPQSSASPTDCTQPLGLLDQLVNLLKLTCLHTVLLRPNSIALVPSSNCIWFAVRTVSCKVSIRVTRLTYSVVVGD